jgi:multidrug resistance efflux pump
MLVFLPILIVVAIVYLYSVSDEEEDSLRASGTVEAVEVIVAPEVAGRVVEVMVGEGDMVDEGDPLLRLDDELLQAQRAQVNAAIVSAEAALRTAQTQLILAELQVELTRRAARLAELPARSAAWEATNPSEFDLSSWYFEKEERIRAAEVEVSEARSELETERSSLQDLLEDPSQADLVEAENRLVEAQAAFHVVDQILDQARRARDDEALEDYAEELHEAALDELEAAQSEYEQLRTEKEAEDILELRARVSVAQARYDIALDRLAALQTGEHSLEVNVAEIGLEQAMAAVAQAEARLAQVQTELNVIDLHLEKLVLLAPSSGVISTRNVEPGEVIQPGAVAMTLDRLEDLTITVYVAEDRYGLIRLGQRAIVIVDSFPDETFSATVIRIADQAEYTPRNVQTDEGRRTTVFAVELTLSDPTGRLKPGMPADVDFGD